MEFFTKETEVFLKEQDKNYGAKGFNESGEECIRELRKQGIRD